MSLEKALMSKEFSSLETQERHSILDRLLLWDDVISYFPAVFDGFYSGVSYQRGRVAGVGSVAATVGVFLWTAYCGRSEARFRTVADAPLHIGTPPNYARYMTQGICNAAIIEAGAFIFGYCVSGLFKL